MSTTKRGPGTPSTQNLFMTPPPPAITLLKQVGPSATGPWTSFLTATIGSNVYYQFTIENTGDVALTNVSVSDPTVTAVASCSWVDGDGTALGTQPISLPVADTNNNQ